MNCFIAKIWLMIFTLLVLLHTGTAIAAESAQQHPRCDYVAYQRLPLTKKLHGVDGALVILRDRSVLAVEQYSFEDNETSCNARLHLEGPGNTPIATHALERPIARIEATNLVGGRPASFALTVDYSSGIGSYSGPATRFFDVVAGEIRWLQAKDKKTGTLQELVVASTLKTEWKLVPNGQHQDILEVRCRPAFKGEYDDSFEVTYKRYRFNGHGWMQYSRSEKGFWESDGTFPQVTLFPR
ncbi:hypothetical protein SAMN02745119_00522 [Trichlorobacter thiogenes]|uniref:Uncharacterized protein n=1 Tax=Trichlorobacter thiogenes TaxID=115783 RepID=A0A1T4KF22_9BACT|nr:hypothetical protein [Trichlorobacter thiogenes]SJZ41058.1 hypothetical protein SAMN02745119_00522 [Trichlorobacter thiogenes]